MMIFLIGMFLFFSIHSVSLFSLKFRNELINRYGESKWKGFFSIIASIGLTLLIFGYVEERRAPLFVYSLPAYFRTIVWFIMLPVFPLFFLAYMPGTLKEVIPHPMVTSIILWSGSHLLVNGMFADILLFGSFLVWSIFIYISMIKNPRSNKKNQNIPLQIKYDLLAMILGLLIYFSYFLWFHEMFIGVPVR